MQFNLKKEGKFSYIEQGEGNVPIILLHGLLGTLSNFKETIVSFSKTHKVIFPLLPLFELDVLHTNIKGLVRYLENFIKHKGFSKIHLVGNSLGGHVALAYTLKHQSIVESLTLTGSSGLFESGMGETYPKRGNYEYIRKKAQEVFFDPEVATKELVDEVYETVNNRIKVLKIIWLAKSATRTNMSKDLKHIKTKTLLIWGKEDKVTPPFVGKEFNEGLENSELHIIEHCGHAPMMEKPKEFNAILDKFLNETKF